MMLTFKAVCENNPAKLSDAKRNQSVMSVSLYEYSYSLYLIHYQCFYLVTIRDGKYLGFTRKKNSLEQLKQTPREFFVSPLTYLSIYIFSDLFARKIFFLHSLKPVTSLPSSLGVQSLKDSINLMTGLQHKL